MKALREIESKVQKDSYEENLEIILFATAVGRHSLEYWYENYFKWLTKFCSKVTDSISDVREVYPNIISNLPDVEFKSASIVTDLDPSGYPYYMGLVAIPGEPTKAIQLFKKDNGEYMGYVVQGPPGTIFDETTQSFVLLDYDNGSVWDTWVAMGYADLTGGIEAGFVLGLASATVTVGTVAVPGWAAGFITRAVGSSVSYAFDDLWDYMMGL